MLLQYIARRCPGVWRGALYADEHTRAKFGLSNADFDKAVDGENGARPLEDSKGKGEVKTGKQGLYTKAAWDKKTKGTTSL
jgi:hypothetical protein